MPQEIEENVTVITEQCAQNADNATTFKIWSDNKVHDFSGVGMNI